MSVLDKMKEMLKGHESQAGKAVDKAGDMIDEKTGGKYAGQVDMVQNQAKKQLGVDEQSPEQPPEQAPPAADGDQSA